MPVNEGFFVLQDQQDQIDAVITWVDGSDPVLAEKRRKYLADPSLPGAAATRFASNDEVLYCTLSILRFAPFFRKIWFVTDNQTPPVFDAVNRLFPDQAHKLGVVDHREIFAGYEEFLPTFNSSTISQMLHRIPGLAERFVYFNDDVFLTGPIESGYFFDGEKPTIRGRWFRARDQIKLARQSLRGMLSLTPRARRPFGGIPLQMNAARLAGSSSIFIAKHVPHPLRRSVLIEFERSHRADFRRNLSFRFRDISQFAVEALANHFEIERGNARILDRGNTDGYVYIDASRNGTRRILRRLARAGNPETHKFLCVQSLDQSDIDKQRLIVNWLDKQIKAPIQSVPVARTGGDASLRTN